MNDRYLYRAKRKNWRELPKEKWWVEGYYAYMQPYHYIMPKDNFDSWIEIDEKTLCACTGLKDKHGKLIWENDIVHNGNYFVVKWNLSCARFDFALNNSHNIPVGRWEPMIIDWKNSDFKEYRNNIDFEVIGNIFDNPELLEVENEAR